MCLDGEAGGGPVLLPAICPVGRRVGNSNLSSSPVGVPSRTPSSIWRQSRLGRSRHAPAGANSWAHNGTPCFQLLISARCKIRYSPSRKSFSLQGLTWEAKDASSPLPFLLTRSNVETRSLTRSKTKSRSKTPKMKIYPKLLVQLPHAIARIGALFP